MTTDNAEFSRIQPQDGTPPPSQEGRVRPFLYNRFLQFCAEEGLTADMPVSTMTQPMVADAAHSFIVGEAIVQVQNREGKLLPEGPVQDQLRLYYHQHSPQVTNNPGRRDIEIEFRRRHIELARRLRPTYPQIDLADRLLHAALQAKQRYVAYGIADLMTAYGMAVEQMGHHAGGTAVRHS